MGENTSITYPKRRLAFFLVFIPLNILRPTVLDVFSRVDADSGVYLAVSLFISEIIFRIFKKIKKKSKFLKTKKYFQQRILAFA